MAEHRTRFVFKSKWEHIANVNVQNMAYPNQHINIEILHGSRDLLIVPDKVKNAFNLGIASAEKARSKNINEGWKVLKKGC